MTAIEDADAVGGTRTLTHTVSGYGTVTSADPVTVTVTDNNMAGVTISETDLEVTEGAEGSYTVVLDTEPAGTVEVTIAADSGTAPPITFSPASLTFRSDNWADTQTVTVTATEDNDVLGGTRTLLHTVSGYGEVTSAAPVMVTVDDRATFTFNPPQLTVAEGDRMATLTLMLDKAIPNGFEVTVSTTGFVALSDDATAGSDYTATTTTLTFEGTENETKTFTVPILDDDVAEDTEQFTAGLVDGAGQLMISPANTIDFVDFSAASAVITINDDDTAGVILSATELTVIEGAAGNYTVMLASDPVGTVEVTIAADSGTAPPITVSPAFLSFDSTTWATAQTVTVTADPDADVVGGTRTLAHTVSGYGTVTSADPVTVTVTDSNMAGVTVSEAAVEVAEGGEGTYTVVLDSAPTVSATVMIAMDSSTTTAPITVSPASLTFSSTNWADTQTVTVTATEDTDALGGMRTLTHTVTGYGDVATAASVTVTVTDDDRATVAFVDLVTDLALPTGTDPLPSDTPVATVMEATPSVEATFRVVLNARDDLDTIVIMGYTADFTATDVEDYTLNWPGPDSDQFVITVPAGDLVATETFTMSVVSDEIVEGNEAIQFPRLFVNGVAPTSPQPEFLKIVDDDVATVSLDSPTVGERVGMVTVVATVDKAVARGFTIPISTADGTGPGAAVAGSDYTMIGTDLVFSGDVEETREFTVVILNDATADGDKTFSVLLGTPVSPAASDARFTSAADHPVINTGASSTVTISDADVPPTGIALSLSPSSVTEGTSEFVLVTAAFVPPDTSQVDVITVPVRVGASPGTATADTDFTAISNIIMVTIPARATASIVPGEFMFDDAGGYDLRPRRDRARGCRWHGGQVHRCRHDADDH